MARIIGGVLAGFVVLALVVAGLQYLGLLLFPFDPDAMALPLGALLVAFASELFGAFLGALTAARIAGRHQRWVAAGLVGLALAGSIMNWMAFPHPLWFMAGQLVGYPLVLASVIHLTKPTEGESRPG